MAKKNGYVSFIDKQSKLVKILLALPVLDGFFFGLYRICKGHVIAGLLWIVLGATIMWIVDIISILLDGNVKLFA